MGWDLFKYYKYWFILTLCTIPMGFIGYYINKKNWLSVIILLPMLILLAFLGLGYFSATIEKFPYHMLSLIACIAMIIIIVLNIFDKTKYKITSLSIVAVVTIIYAVLNGGLTNADYETYKTLDSYNITFNGEIYVSSFTGTAKGNVEVINSNSIKLIGRKNGKYTFSISDDSGTEYTFEYYFDKENNTVVLERKKELR